MSKLIPPDKSKCQAERPNGHSFMSLGGQPGHVRCSSPPTVIVTERRAAKDGKKGSMSLCDDCLTRALTQLGATYFTIAEIKK